MAERIEVEVGNDEFLAMLNHAREDLGAVEQPLAAWVTAEPQQSTWDKAADYFIDKMVPEITDMLKQKWQEGANEIAKGLFGQSDGFVLYGHQNLQPAKEMQSSFDGQLYEASLRAMPEQDREMER